MLNQIVLVGRLVETPIKEENGDGRSVTSITLAVPRSFKNVDGEYDTDFLPVILWDGVAKSTTEYCRKGDLIGVKGRVQGLDGEIKLVAEKVTFLSSTSKSDEEAE